MIINLIKNKNNLTKEEVFAYKTYVESVKINEEIVTLREWYDSSPEKSVELEQYMLEYKNLGRLGKELHNRNIPRVTERFGDKIRTHVEATYKRGVLDYAAPLCAIACCINRSRCK